MLITANDANGNANLIIDLSKGNSVFGASTTVQVASLPGQHLIRYC